jgi:hypothetical protein
MAETGLGVKHNEVMSSVNWTLDKIDDELNLPRAGDRDMQMKMDRVAVIKTGRKNRDAHVAALEAAQAAAVTAMQEYAPVVGTALAQGKEGPTLKAPVIQVIPDRRDEYERALKALAHAAGETVDANEHVNFLLLDPKEAAPTRQKRVTFDTVQV